MTKLTQSQLSKIGKTFEQEYDDITGILEYYSGVDGFTIEKTPSHPDHLWTILDRLESDIMNDDKETAMEMTYKQQEFLLYFVRKWRNEIEKYCVRLESE